MSKATHLLLRFSKIASAIILLALSLWALLLPPYFPSSTHSVVNARKVHVESNTPGMVSGLPTTPHEPVNKGQCFANIEGDQRQLTLELKQQEFLQNRLQTQITHTQSAIQQISGELTQAKLDYTQQQAAYIKTIEQTLKANKEALDLKTKYLATIQQKEIRIQLLFEEGIITQSQQEDHTERLFEAEEKISQINSEIAKWTHRKEAIQLGVHLNNSDLNDGLSAQISTLEHNLREQQNQEIKWQNQLSETVALIESSQTYIKQNQNEPISSPVDGVIWRHLVVNGQIVTAGQPIVQVADAQSIFIEAFFNRHYLNTISLGDHAHILLSSEDRHIEGIVMDIQIQENHTPDLNIISSSSPNKEMLRILIHIEPNTLQTKHVGKLTKVVLSSASPGLMERSLIWLSFLLRNHD